jgi:hypothetical protein
MKRIFALLLVMSLTLAGCSASSPSTPNQSPTSKEFEFPAVKLSSPITLDNLDPELVRPVAGRLMWEDFKASPKTTVKLNHVISPNYPIEIQKSSLGTYQAASDFFGEVGDVSNSYIFWITAKDADWINDAMCKEAKYCPNTGKQYHDIGASMKQSGDCGNGGGELRMGDNNVVADCWFEGQDPNKINPAAHAFTHFVEMSTFKDQTYSSWWIEGTANQFEWFLKGAVVKNYDEYIYGIAGAKNIWDNQSLFKVPENPTASDFNKMFDIVESGRGDGHWMFGYYLGSLCVEALVAVYGPDVVKNNFVLVGQLGFEKAFKKSFGLTTKEFRKKVMPYVMARYKLDQELMKPYE